MVPVRCETYFYRRGSDHHGQSSFVPLSEVLSILYKKGFPSTPCFDIRAPSQSGKSLSLWWGQMNLSYVFRNVSQKASAPLSKYLLRQTLPFLFSKVLPMVKSKKWMLPWPKKFGFIRFAPDSETYIKMDLIVENKKLNIYLWSSKIKAWWAPGKPAIEKLKPLEPALTFSLNEAPQNIANRVLDLLDKEVE